MYANLSRNIHGSPGFLPTYHAHYQKYAKKYMKIYERDTIYIDLTTNHPGSDTPPPCMQGKDKGIS
jgi:hypothetical protein